jgi:ankyrin repeat protein
VRLLLEFGASVRVPNTLKHVLDYEQMEGLQLLLAAGADPNAVNPKGETALHWAVWRGRSAEIVAALLDGGAEVNARRGDGRTAYALAVRSGQAETAALLKARGADTELAEMDAALGRWAASDGLVTRGVTVTEEMKRLLPEFASSHCTSAARALLKAGVPTDTLGDYDCTALHWACWKGYADLVEVLLEYGASLTIEDGTYHATPVGWFSHGLQNSVERDGDYPQTARILLAAGVGRKEFQVPSGDDAVDAVLMN